MAKQILSEDKPEMVALMKATLINEEGNIAWRRLEQLVSIGRFFKMFMYLSLDRKGIFLLILRLLLDMMPAQTSQRSIPARDLPLVFGCHLFGCGSSWEPSCCLKRDITKPHHVFLPPFSRGIFLLLENRHTQSSQRSSLPALP